MIDAVARTSMLGVCCYQAAKPTTNLYNLVELDNIFVHTKRRTVLAHHCRCLPRQASFSLNPQRSLTFNLVFSAPTSSEVADGVIEYKKG